MDEGGFGGGGAESGNVGGGGGGYSGGGGAGNSEPLAAGEVVHIIMVQIKVTLTGETDGWVGQGKEK